MIIIRPQWRDLTSGGSWTSMPSISKHYYTRLVALSSTEAYMVTVIIIIIAILIIVITIIIGVIIMVTVINVINKVFAIIALIETFIQVGGHTYSRGYSTRNWSV